jgi:hypothetical protein
VDRRGGRVHDRRTEGLGRHGGSRSVRERGASRSWHAQCGRGGLAACSGTAGTAGAEVAAQPAPLSRTIVHPFRGSRESAQDPGLELQSALRHRTVSAVPWRPRSFGTESRRLHSQRK